MRPDQRIVTQIPLQELWTARGPLTAERLRTLGPSDLAIYLNSKPMLRDVAYIVADMGHPLHWMNGPEFLSFWKSDARGRVVEADATAFPLADFPDEYCYVVSEWRAVEPETRLVLFERHH